MPALADLSGEPTPGYERIAAFAASNGDRPPGWFIEQYPEFSPTLLILGRFYDIQAASEWEARVGAQSRFAADLSRHKLPLPHDPVRTELDDWR